MFTWAETLQRAMALSAGIVYRAMEQVPWKHVSTHAQSWLHTDKISTAPLAFGGVAVGRWGCRWAGQAVII
jgi:hypothetical protein